jgi:hypothetical protein
MIQLSVRALVQQQANTNNMCNTGMQPKAVSFNIECMQMKHILIVLLLASASEEAL